MKFLLFAMGPGEASHGNGIVKLLRERGHQVTFALLQTSIPFYSLTIPDLVITPTLVSLQTLVDMIRPDAILMCNSKSFAEYTLNAPEFIEIRPWKTVPTFGIDSNWLFEATGLHRSIQWLDQYFVVFHPYIFNLGLKEYGGYFTIPSKILSRIKPVGFVPSYDKPDEQTRRQVRQQLHVQEHEKLIFCYISGRGSDVKTFILQSLLTAVSVLRRKGHAIKVFVIGNIDLVEYLDSYDNDWCFLQRQIVDDFYSYLASADLIFQHHGLATMAQAISANIPVIANVDDPLGTSSLGTAVDEILPFHRAGLCTLLYEHSSLQQKQDTIEALLYDGNEIDKMQQAQRNYYSRGEENIYVSMMNYIVQRSEGRLME